MPLSPTELDALETERTAVRRELLRDPATRAETTGRGIHHTALISSDVRRTVTFYQDVLGFPLTEIFENRDYPGSSHFFFDVGGGNAIAFFDLPGLDLGPYAEVLGGLHHCAISVAPRRWQEIKDRMDEAGMDYLLESEVSIYFRDPDGARLEVIADPLGEMYGERVV